MNFWNCNLHSTIIHYFTGEVIEDIMLNESVISEIDSESSNDSSCNDSTFDSDKSENSFTDESSNVSFEK